VQHFITLANKHLVEKGLEIIHQVQFSDGSPTQYKSKLNFCDASFGKEDFCFSVEKCFFWSRHGKGPCDGEIGVIKKNALAAVKTRQKIISDAEQLFESCKDALCLPSPMVADNPHTHAKSTFIFVNEGDIIRDRKERKLCKVVPNTRSLHSVVGIDRYVVKTRVMSYFCKACVSPTKEVTLSCPNLQYTGEWLEVILNQKAASSRGRSNALKRKKGKQKLMPLNPTVESDAPNPMEELDPMEDLERLIEDCTGDTPM
jgi:hypothetical protein